MGRSGSTLLEFLLDAHPNVNIPLESRFIIHLYYKYSSKTNWSNKDKESFIKDLYKDYKLKIFWKIDGEKLKNDIYNTPSDVSFFELCRIITANYISFYPKKEIKIQGNKNPIYALWCDCLDKLNRESKFIHLVRNPLGVVASHKKLKNKNLKYFAYRWNLMNYKIEELKQKKPENFITVKYEDLINNTEQTLQLICEFLNINYLPEQLNYNQMVIMEKDKIDAVNDKERMDMFNSHLKNLIYPIKKSIIDSWENTLTLEEINDTAYISKKSASKYGYEFKVQGNFKLSFIFAYFKVIFRYFKFRLYYYLSLPLKLK